MFDRLQFWFGNGWSGILDLLITAFCVFLSLSFHEFCHGLAAYKMGDDTARLMGRLNLNPTSHLDPFGTFCLFFFGFGWAKPVPVNPMRFKNGKYKSGMVITSLAGPLGNFVLAFLTLAIYRVVYLFVPVENMGEHSLFMLYNDITITLAIMNIGLGVFNLLPVPPLDGSKILNAVLPARIYFKIMQYERYGFIILILLLNMPIVSNILDYLQFMIYRGFISVLHF